MDSPSIPPPYGWVMHERVVMIFDAGYQANNSNEYDPSFENRG
ncbi:MAG TPA: hypothetical protein VKA87_03430 [Nitrososphaeraceae archaeon]|nr:hypothetical protein [Nitrososphaeraceae archaeon]